MLITDKMKQFIFITFTLFTMGFSLTEKRVVEIQFDQLFQLQQLVEMGIDLDHHRTLTKVHAFVTDAEFEQIQLLYFEIKEKERKKRL